MGAGRLGGERGARRRKRYSGDVELEAPSSVATCSFCRFVLTLYPDLKRLKEKDAVVFKAHLDQVHGLGGEIEP